MRRILLDATAVRKGGGIQATISFLGSLALEDETNRWLLALSRQVADAWGCAAFPAIGVEVAVTPRRPVQPLADRLALSRLVRRFSPHAVYTIFGPSYYRPDVPHAVGFANATLVRPPAIAHRLLPPLRRLKARALVPLRRWFLRGADAYIVETEAIARDLSRTCAVPRERIAVIPNSASPSFHVLRGTHVEPSPRLPAREPGEFRLLALSAYYPHKNLEIIPDVARALRAVAPTLRARLVMTLPPGDAHARAILAKAVRLGVGDRVITAGAVPHPECPGLYAGCDALFLPTVLESFTATYPEAWAMDRPVITTDEDFARAICGDAALYFRWDDPVAAARAIAALAGDAALREALVAAGRERFDALPGPDEKAELALRIVEAVADGQPLPAAPIPAGAV